MPSITAGDSPKEPTAIIGMCRDATCCLQLNEQPDEDQSDVVSIDHEPGLHDRMVRVAGTGAEGPRRVQVRRLRLQAL